MFWFPVMVVEGASLVTIFFLGDTGTPLISSCCFSGSFSLLAKSFQYSTSVFHCCPRFSLSTNFSRYIQRNPLKQRPIAITQTITKENGAPLITAHSFFILSKRANMQTPPLTLRGEYATGAA